MARIAGCSNGISPSNHEKPCFAIQQQVRTGLPHKGRPKWFGGDPVIDKKTLSFEDIAGQAALELPSRELPALVNVFVIDSLNRLTVVRIDSIDVDAFCAIQLSVLGANYCSTRQPHRP
jgi:hypothetical protein